MDIQNKMIEIEKIPVFILAGGLGTRMKEETEFKPKPMVTIGKYPILWHIMKFYSSYGFKRFVICTGFKSEVIKSYFLNYYSLNSDFTINLRSNSLKIHSIDHNEDWEVTVAYTGELTMTGARIAIAAEKYLDTDHFAVTYGDGLCNVDLRDEFNFHLSHGKIGTVLGVNPVSRFGQLRVEGDRVIKFVEKPEFKDEWINGGYFFFRKEFLKYLSKDENCVLEKKPLENLAEDGELRVYFHYGFWGCMDTQRDREYLTNLWESGRAPWAIWLKKTE